MSDLFLVRTLPLGTGVRGVFYLPTGVGIHTLEDKPIPPGRYFLTPDETGRHRNWVIERGRGTRIAYPARLDHMGHTISEARTDVEVHAGNDLTDTDGCIIFGLGSSRYGVSQSRPAIDLARTVLGRDTGEPRVWTIEIVDGVCV
jgi:hypothetical protein